MQCLYSFRTTTKNSISIDTYGVIWSRINYPNSPPRSWYSKETDEFTLGKDSSTSSAPLMNRDPRSCSGSSQSNALIKKLRSKLFSKKPRPHGCILLAKRTIHELNAVFHSIFRNQLESQIDFVQGN